MSPEGIEVVEIDLNLPNASYYLQWAPPEPADPRGLVQQVRDTGKRLGWTIFAAGSQEDVMRLLLQTSAANLDSGLAALPGCSGRYRLYLVQAETALPRVARHVHQRSDVRGPTASPQPLNRQPGLPEIHHGLFIGQRSWADGMLDVLTRRAAQSAPSPAGTGTLPEIAGRHPSHRQAIAEAYRSGAFSLKDIAEHFDMHFSEVSAIVNAAAT